MYSALYKELTEAEKIEYLARIGITDEVKPTVADLTRLVWAHHCMVPFENLDVCDYNLVPSLAIDALFDKVVTRRRGGYCFEMNAIFHALLKAVGFEIIPCIGKVGGPSPMGPMPSLHRVNLAVIDGERYFCDVGFGGFMPRGCLKFVNDVKQELAGKTFHFEGVENDWAILYNDSESPAEPMFQIYTHPQEPVDFVPPNAITGGPTGFFAMTRIVNLTKPNGSAALSNNRLTVREDGNVTITEIKSQRQYYDALEDVFGIVLPPREFPTFGKPSED